MEIVIRVLLYLLLSPHLMSTSYGLKCVEELAATVVGSPLFPRGTGLLGAGFCFFPTQGKERGAQKW
ncbi:unnamed protein product [Spirodela intermedia]|uniref:Uncharacterized protein n=1 Tax=Spirodela intermedia TaxID=51605 RepID=A0A7I8ITP8_SPIIN|nr:unnamed protein product [Spirodela intermedia]CAA6661344.1 unnamed protein product [Spirodela intermedia]